MQTSTITRFVILATGLSLSCPAAAAERSYVIDPTHSFASYAISHLGFSTSSGRFQVIEGQITLDPEKGSGKVDVTLPVASVSTGVAKLDEHLQKPDFFDVEHFPDLHFVSNRLHFENGVLTQVDGQLDMHGETHPVTLTVTAFKCGEHPMLKKPHCGADASATLQRSQWGLNTYIPLVGDEVRLTIQIEATAGGE